MNTLYVWMFQGEGVQVERVRFVRVQTVLDSVRGKSGGALGNIGSFQWTAGVQALFSLLIRHKVWGGGTRLPESDALIRGTEGSHAASLDYAITKRPLWILDMFGYESDNRPFVSRLFQRTNPDRKRPGPVVIGINPNVLPPQQIIIYLNDLLVESVESLVSLLTALEVDTQTVRKNPITPRGDCAPGFLAGVEKGAEC